MQSVEAFKVVCIIITTVPILLCGMIPFVYIAPVEKETLYKL